MKPIYFIPVLRDFAFYKLTLFDVGGAGFTVLEEKWPLTRDMRGSTQQHLTQVHVLPKMAPKERDEAVQAIARSLT